MHKKFVFGYGSLINLESCSKTLQRTLTNNDVITAHLHDYSRIWNYTRVVYSEKLQMEVNAVFLNVVEKKGMYINGILFEVSDSELENLKIREKYYDLVNVEDKIRGLTTGQVYTFVCKDISHMTLGQDYIIMNKYLQIVYDGCIIQGRSFYDEFLRSTESTSFDIIEGNYSFL